MCRSNFRIKIDLSRFYKDARRICWIFVDCEKFLNVYHVMQHIAKVFHITEPFHLLVNKNEYLPPMEHVRILDETEIILVMPGTGLFDQSSSDNATQPILQINTIPRVISIKSLRNSETQTVDLSLLKTEMDTSDKQNTTNAMQTGLHETTMYHSVIEPQTDQEDTDRDSRIESCTEKVASVPRRKRIRKRKPKNQNPLPVSNGTSSESNRIKPKLSNSSGAGSKHIRFDAEEEETSRAIKNTIQAEENSANGTYLERSVSSNDLATLLALKQCSTPLTFVNKNAKKIKIEDTHTEDTTANTVSNETIQKSNNDTEFPVYHFDKFEIMTDAPQLKDLIAFKLLKIGPDYTPQVSNFIVGRVVVYDMEHALYTLRIIKGLEEIQLPTGKFAMSDNDTVRDTITVNRNEILEPRLVQRATLE